MAGILEGKVALITGAGSGIGRATSKIFSREGARLVLADVVEEGGLQTLAMVVVGNPDEVIRKLETFQTAGLDQVICFKQAGRIPHQNIMNSLTLMGKHVIGHFNPHRRIALDDVQSTIASEAAGVGAK
jgi:NAD(P)-dependent dehydrogenase (short-subunit alcohol dehydrogenase family)